MLEGNDLIPALPTELILQIFQYLHIHDTWSLQLVNRRWRTALSSDQFLRAVLLRWDTHDASDSGRPTEPTDSIRDRVRHAQSLRFGKAFSQVDYDSTGTGFKAALYPHLSQRRFDLKGRKIAYISSTAGERDSIVLRDLVTGLMSSFHGDALEKEIYSLVLSSELLAYVTCHGRLHIAKLTGPAWSTSLRLPSTKIRALGADGTTVAVAIGVYGCNVLHISEVLLVDANSWESRTVKIALGQNDISERFWGGDRQGLNSCSILVDSQKYVIDLFSLVFYREAYASPRSYLEILHLRVSFAGENLTKETWCDVLDDDELQAEGHIPKAGYTMAPPVALGYQGLYRIQVGEVPVHGNLPLRLKFYTFFDANESSDDNDDEWTEKYGFVHNEGELQPTKYEVADSPYRCDQVLGNVNAQWKGLAIQATKQPDTEWLEYHSLMNDTFLVSLEICTTRTEHSRIRVFCFDPKIDLPGGRSTGFWEDDEFQPKPRWRKKGRDTSTDESDL